MLTSLVHAPAYIPSSGPGLRRDDGNHGGNGLTNGRDNGGNVAVSNVAVGDINGCGVHIVTIGIAIGIAALPVPLTTPLATLPM